MADSGSFSRPHHPVHVLLLFVYTQFGHLTVDRWCSAAKLQDVLRLAGGIFFFLPPTETHWHLDALVYIYPPRCNPTSRTCAFTIVCARLLACAQTLRPVCRVEVLSPPLLVTFWVSRSTQSPSLFPVNEKTPWCSPSELHARHPFDISAPPRAFI